MRIEQFNSIRSIIIQAFLKKILFQKSAETYVKLKSYKFRKGSKKVLKVYHQKIEKFSLHSGPDQTKVNYRA